jgi:hypothetical protein
MVLRKLAAGVAGALLLATVASLAAPGTATAATQEGIGFNVTPAQPYLHNPDASDWMGSFVVGGKQVWCVNFAFKAPDSNEQYKPGDALLTKWGTPLDPTIASEISYLLLRYGTTKSADDAAALAHLLHSWTAAPQTPSQLASTNDFRHIAYDVNYHLSKLPASAQKAVATLQADASANHGPWTTSMTAPTTPQLIGTASNWTVNVLNAAKKGMGTVPVTLTATDATLPNGTGTQTINTPDDGSPLTVALTPTGLNPKLVATLDSPAATPAVQAPLATDVQEVVTTGGTTKLTSTATTPAKTAPGNVKITKTDANTKAPIPGVTLEITGSDKVAAALKQDGSALNGTDSKPLVLTTGVDGTATIQGLQTPQAICLIETTPPPGYDQAFDPKAPPTVCGTVNPGDTLALSLTNKPNKVPVAIPAGGPPPTMTAMAMVVSKPLPGALIGFGGLLVIGAGFAGSVFVRRTNRRHGDQ